MILGNSRGNNKGKKYMIRKSHNLQSTPVTEAKAELFATWFADNYPKIEEQLLRKDIYDADAIHETYLRMYEGILYKDTNIADNASYFYRAYYTNMIQERMKGNRFVADGEAKLDFVMDEPYDEKLEMRMRQLECDVMDYVHSRYKLREFEIFKMYVSLKPAINYDMLAEITQIQKHCIQHMIGKIKKDVRKSVFAKRRRELHTQD